MSSPEKRTFSPKPDTAVELWLGAEVTTAYDAIQADLERIIAADQVFAAVRARHADRVKRKPPEP